MRVAILGLLALLVGGGTLLMAKEWLASERSATTQAQPAPVPTTEVLVTAVDLEVGQFVKPEDLRWQAWPEDNVAESFIMKSDDAVAELSGTVVRSPIAAGEPITDARLVRPGDRGFLAAVLTPGMRAVSVPVNATSGIAGLIFPGDHVDVILTHAVQQQTGAGLQVRQVSETVLTNVRVLAIDQSVSLDTVTGTVGDTATIEVTPQQAEKVSVMMQIGRLSLSLRSLAESDSPEPGHTVTMDTDVSSLIYQPQEEEQVAPAPAPPPQITIVRGGQSSLAQPSVPQPAVPEPATPQPGPSEASGGAPSGDAPDNLR